MSFKKLFGGVVISLSMVIAAGLVFPENAEITAIDVYGNELDHEQLEKMIKNRSCASYTSVQNNTENEEEIEDTFPLTDEEVELIAIVTEAEAEGESEYGLRLVIDTILNRVDNEHFPDTVTDVIYQPKHFTVMWNGRAEEMTADEDICKLVREEAEERTDYDVIFFRESRYSDYGEPMFKEGCHYFSSYGEEDK